MAKTKKITMAAIAKAANPIDGRTVTAVYGEGENAIEVTVKTQLALSERIEFVSDIVDTLFISSENGVVYLPSLREFAFAYAAVRYFTNIPLTGNAGKLFTFLEETQLLPWVVHIVGTEYMSKMFAYADEAIEYRKQRELKASKLDELLDRIMAVVNTVNDETQNVDVAQIVNYVQKNMPEFADTVKAMVNEQAAVAPVA